MINNSIWSIDYLFKKYSFLNTLNINGFPLAMLVWNLALLGVPFLCVVLLKKIYKKRGFKNLKYKIFGFVLFLVWFFFFPNSAYIINDIRNLSGYCDVTVFSHTCLTNTWMIMFFFVYASVGWLAFVYLLNQMKGLVSEIWNSRIANWFTVLIIPLTALGVLLGMIHRFNSWEVFITPIDVINSALVYFTDYYHFRNWLIFTIGLYILYFIGNKLFSFGKTGSHQR